MRGCLEKEDFSTPARLIVADNLDRRPWTAADEDRESNRAFSSHTLGYGVRVCERGNVVIQQRQTPLNTSRVPLQWPLSQREKDLGKKNLVLCCGVVPSELGR